MLSFFTVALIALFVVMTWFEAPVEPLVRHHSPEEDADTPATEEHREAA